jgi:hypothetical protein
MYNQIAYRLLHHHHQTEYRRHRLQLLLDIVQYKMLVEELFQPLCYQEVQFQMLLQLQ